MRSVLIVADIPEALVALRLRLQADGYVVAACTTTARDRLFLKTRPDLIVVNPRLLDEAAVALVRAIKREHYRCAIIVAASGSRDAERLAAFEAGADDFVNMPCSVNEILARIQLRFPQVNERFVQIGECMVDLDDASVRRANQLFALTRQEMRVLRVLLRYRNSDVSRMRLFSEAWATSFDGNSRRLDYLIKELRRKLETTPHAPQHIVTVRRVGYKLMLT